jgi:hypothetical protein
LTSPQENWHLAFALRSREKKISLRRHVRPRDCPATKQPDELAPFQLIELHSIPASHFAEGLFLVSPE